MKETIHALLTILFTITGLAVSAENNSPPMPTNVRLIQATPGTNSNDGRGSGLEPAGTPMGKDGSGLGLAGEYQPELLVQNGYKATWSPVSDRLAFGKEGGGIAILDLHTRRVTDLTREGKDPAWSPDGQWLAFDHRGDQGRQIWRIATAQLPKAPTLMSSLPTPAGRPRPTARGSAPVQELVGKPVPGAFKLPLLNGGEFELPSPHNTNVFLLDFWATWCGPCRRIMPALAEVAKAYAGRGVRYVAVNFREEPEVIRRYLAAAKLDIEVALDQDGRMAKAFQLRAIPMMVIMDRSNIIRKVHVGASPAIGDEMRRALDEVLGDQRANEQ